MNYKLAILKNESLYDHILWSKVCEKNKDILDFDIIEITKNDWIKMIQSKNYDLLIARPPGINSQFKQLYDERLIIIDQILKKKIYPSLQEILIYENKKYFSYWLKANKLPHPRTDVFYHKDEAEKYVKSCSFPLVAKINIGAAGNGVVIIKKQEEALKYISDAFSSKGVGARVGPKLFKGNLMKRIQKVLTDKNFLKSRLNTYKSISIDRQRNYVIFQEFIPHTFEWRCVRIGESYFAHKKVVKGEKASGGLVKDYSSPPIALMDFVRSVTEDTNISSAAIDLFEHKGQFLINEIQTCFGHSDEFQMKVDGKIGRYVYLKKNWIFEEGDFNTNESYDLRIAHALKLIMG